MSGIVACCFLQTTALASTPDAAGPGDAPGTFGGAMLRLASSPLAWICLVLCVLIGTVLWRADAIRPQSLSRGGIRDVRPHPAWAWLAAGFAAMLVMSLGSGIALAILHALDGTASAAPDAAMTPASTRDAAIGGACGYAVGIALAITLLIMLRSPAPNAGLRATPRGAALGILGFAAAWPLVTGLGLVLVALHQGLTSAPTPDLAHATLERLTQSPLDVWTMLLIAGAVLGAPIIEELIFRGFVQSGLLRATSRPWTSAIAAAGLFGLLHVAGGTGMPWYAVVVVTVLGLCMGVAYERTRDLATPIVMHILFNASNVMLALLATR